MACIILSHNFKYTKSAFTLAELLIALAILGVIASFTIPKLLQSQNSQRFNAITKETMATLSNAYKSLPNFGSTTLGPGDIINAINTISVSPNTSNNIDTSQLAFTYQPSSINCQTGSGSVFTCALLPNGAVLYYRGQTFNGTGQTNGVYFGLDPDGSAGSANDILLLLFYNGRIVPAKLHSGAFVNLSDNWNTTDYPALPGWYSN